MLVPGPCVSPLWCLKYSRSLVGQASAGASGPSGDTPATHDEARGALHARGPAATLVAYTKLVAMASAEAGRRAAPRAGGMEPLVPPAMGVATVLGLGRMGGTVRGHVWGPEGGAVQASVRLRAHGGLHCSGRYWRAPRGRPSARECMASWHGGGALSAVRAQCNYLGVWLY